jgi:ATP-dependent helicase HepA
VEPLDYKQLGEVLARGRGWVLLDRSGFEGSRSMLHHATCKWLRKVGPRTPLWFDPDYKAAQTWIEANLTDKGHEWKQCGTCKGSRDAAPVPVSQVEGGEGVEAPGDSRFRTGDQVVVDWDASYAVIVAETPRAAVASFDGPWAPEVGRLAIRPAGKPRGNQGLDPARLAQHRLEDRLPCFVRRDGDWVGAEVVRHDKDARSVLVLVDGWEEDVPEEDVRVRRIAAIENPLQALASHDGGGAATYRARHRFHKLCQHFTPFARGLEGVLAASVELHPHQLRVVRRVLKDPFQRYLLADEVGLGKTIEAGLIIRQRYLDAPRSVIHIACPGALVGQWSEELDTKLGIRSFRPRGKTIEAYDEGDKAFAQVETPDLLVIDEAHRIAAGWSSGDDKAEALYAAAAELASRTPRLLLLSATPVLHHERTLLAMFHLLDPDTYRLEDVDTFVKRMLNRETVAGIFSRIDAKEPAFLIREALKEIRKALSEDERVDELAQAVEGALEEDPGASGTLPNAVAALRTHVSETYRMHSRILRQSRRLVAEAGYTIRGRRGVRLVDLSDDLAEEIEGWLNHFRGTLAELAGEDEDLVEAATRFFLLFLERGSGDPACLAALARAVRTRRFADYELAGLSSAEQSALKAIWRSEELKYVKPVVAELEEILDDNPEEYVGWLEALWGALGDEEPEFELGEEKAVVFTTAGDSARRAADFFSERLGPDVVATITDELKSDDRPEVLARFRDDSACRCLFVDRTAEEGLNLQIAALVAMVDLPADTVRVEQRIGRVDRRSDGPPVQCVVLAPETGGLVDLWLGALRDGFRVFNESAAAIQFAVDQVEKDFLQALFLDGDSKVTRDTKKLADAVAEEQARIDRVDSLDALATTPTREAELIGDYHAAEETMPDAVEVLAAVAEAYGDSLGLRVEAEDETTVCVESASENLITDLFLGVAKRPVRLSHDRSGLSLNTEDELARPGAPAMEVLRRLLDWLPDGQTFTAWAESADYSLVAFCCDLVVRANIEEVMALWRAHEAELPRRKGAIRNAADAPLDAAGFHRWADSYLPPVPVRVWLDPAVNKIDDHRLVSELEEGLGEAPPGDSLSDREWRAAEVLAGVQSFDELVGELTDAAQRHALEDAGARNSPQAAAQEFAADMAMDLAQRRLRAERDGSAEAARELIVMEHLIPALRDAIEGPRANWQGAGLVVLTDAGERPE